MLATVAGYGLLDGLSPGLGQRHPGPGRRGILALLADTMFPEAFEHGGRPRPFEADQHRQPVP